MSTRKVDDFVAALGAASGISKSEVSRICAGLDAEVAAFRTRPLGHVDFPYVFADATYLKGRVGGRWCPGRWSWSPASPWPVSERCSASPWATPRPRSSPAEFFRSLRARGLSGVRLVISDHHDGLKAAIAKVFIGAGWQRCRVHFLRNVLAKVPKGSTEMVAAAIRTIFAQPDAAAVADQFERIVDALEPQFSQVASMLNEARQDLLAFSAFPIEHWRKLWSTNPLERLHREIKRRTDVVGVFPNDAAIERLITAVVVEQHDEWAVAERRYLSETSMARLRQSPPALPAPTGRRKSLAG